LLGRGRESQEPRLRIRHAWRGCNRWGTTGRAVPRKSPPLDLADVRRDAACRPGARDAQPVSGGFAVSPCTPEAPAGPVRTVGSSMPTTRKKKQPWPQSRSNATQRQARPLSQRRPGGDLGCRSRFRHIFVAEGDGGLCRRGVPASSRGPPEFSGTIMCQGVVPSRPSRGLYRPPQASLVEPALRGLGPRLSVRPCTWHGNG
jgi:hypothetical protein